MKKQIDRVEKWMVKDYIEIRNTGKYGFIRCSDPKTRVARELIGCSKAQHKSIIFNFDYWCKEYDLNPDTLFQD
tara:strand:+ start:81 stop:302 length:222 start_codon:yes stop_codon:yes gene_type:complete